MGAFQAVLVVKNPPVNAGDPGDAGSIPRLERSNAAGNGNPPQYSCLGNPMNREADCSMPGFPVLHYLLELAQSHVH